jgi:hypothetical protein
MWGTLATLVAAAGIFWFAADLIAERRTAKVERAIAAERDRAAEVSRGWQDYHAIERAADAAQSETLARENASMRAQLNANRNRNVSANAIAGCTLTRGIVQQHNDAATGRATVPDAGSDLVDRPAGIGIDRYAATVDGNYTTCREDQSRLLRLQSRIRTLCREWNTRFGHPLAACDARATDGEPESPPRKPEATTKGR